MSAPDSRDDGLQGVDARLRQGRCERGVVDDVDGRGAERARLRGDVAHAATEHDPCDIAEGSGLGEHAEAALRQVAVVGLEVDERAGHQTSLFSARYSTILSAALPSSSIRTWSLLAGGGATRAHDSPRARFTDRVGVDPDVGERDDLLRLRLRPHDPLERGVARLVDRVRHGNEGRQRRRDHVVAELRLPLAGEAAAVDRELGDLRDHRSPQPVRDGRPEHGAVGVARLLPEEHELRLLPLERFRERVARREKIRAGCRLVGDEHGAVGAHRERLAERVHRLLRPERDHHDLAALRLLESKCLLDGIDVRGVERALPRAVETVRPRVEPLVDGGVRDLLDADGDLHAADSSEGGRDAFQGLSAPVIPRVHAAAAGRVGPIRLVVSRPSRGAPEP